MHSLVCNYTLCEIFIFLCSGNIGTELSSTNSRMFITSDAGNSWRQVRPMLVRTMRNRLCVHTKSVFFRRSPMQIFDDVHHVWFLDNGGAMLAVLHAATPIRHLWYVISAFVITGWV